MSEARGAGSTKPSFKMNTSARMRIGPVETPTEDEPPAEGDVPLVDGQDGWYLMIDAPHDGSLVYLKHDDKAADVTAMIGVWRTTRMYCKETKRWVTIGLWVDPLTRLQIPFDPFVWRHARGNTP
jgi:hypothetical protein